MVERPDHCAADWRLAMRHHPSAGRKTTPKAEPNAGQMVTINPPLLLKQRAVRENRHERSSQVRELTAARRREEAS